MKINSLVRAHAKNLNTWEKFIQIDIYKSLLLQQNQDERIYMETKRNGYKEMSFFCRYGMWKVLLKMLADLHLRRILCRFFQN